MNARLAFSDRQRGLSLVELMVAITIGLFLLAGAVSIFTSSKRTYTEQDDSSRMQESLRFAVDMIARDVRMAGYFGCAYGINPSNLKNSEVGTASLFDQRRGPIQGFDSQGTQQWWPTPTCADCIQTVDNTVVDAASTVTPATGSDAITIRHAGGPQWRVTAAMADATASIAVNNVASDDCVNADGAAVSCANADALVFGGMGTTIQANNLVAITSCGTAEIFKATSAAPIAHAAPLNAAYGPASTGGPDAIVSRATFVRYFVGMNNGEPALYREEPNAAGNGLTQTLLLPGVENMQITYGVDTDATKDGAPNTYLRAGAAGLQTPAEWANVVSVRIGMMARSQTANALEGDTMARSLNGTAMTMDATNQMLVDAGAGAAAAANDNRRRRAMETTVMLRNRFTPGNFGG